MMNLFETIREVLRRSRRSSAIAIGPGAARRRSRVRSPSSEVLEVREVLSGLGVVDATSLLHGRHAAAPAHTAARFGIAISSAAATAEQLQGGGAWHRFAADRTVRAGTPATIELTARTARGRIDTTYEGTVVLSSSDPNAVFASKTVTFSAGRAKVEVTFAATGRQTIVASDEASGTIRGRAAVRVVTPLQATQFAVILGDGTDGARNAAASKSHTPFGDDPIRVGSPTTVRVIALDAKRRPVWDYDGKIELTSSDTGAKLPGTVEFRRGRATFQVTFSAEGEQTLTVADASDANIRGVGKATVAPAQTATHFAVTIGNQRFIAFDKATTAGANAPAMWPPIFWDPAVRVGLPTLMSVTALDDQDREVLDFSGTVTLSSSDAGVQFESDKLTFSYGTAFTEVTFSAVGTQTVTVVDADDASVTGTGTVDVQAAQVVTHFGVTIGDDFRFLLPLLGAQSNGANAAADTAQLTIARPSYGDDAVRTGVPTGVRIVALDKDDLPVWNYSGSVSLNSSDGGATFAANPVTFSYGYAWTQVTFSQTGLQTVTAVDAADANVSGTGSVDVEAPLQATHFGVYFGPFIMPLFASGGGDGGGGTIGGGANASYLPPLRMPGAVVGTPAIVRLVALDAKNRPVLNYAGTVNLTSSDTGAKFDSDAVTFAGGFASAQVTFAAAGKQTVTAVDAADANLLGTGTVTVFSITQTT